MGHRRDLITGVAGQDVSYVAEQLMADGTKVLGTVKPNDARASSRRSPAIKNVLRQISVHPVRVEDTAAVRSLLRSLRPDECHHLAAETAVQHDVSKDVQTFEVNAVPDCRLCFAASGAIFGNAGEARQNERTAARPRSVYGFSKSPTLELARYYGSRPGLYAASAILFNHESPRRDPFFVSRKITRSVARIRSGIDRELHLGSLDSQRDCEHARDYVTSMPLTLCARARQFCHRDRQTALRPGFCWACVRVCRRRLEGFRPHGRRARAVRGQHSPRGRCAEGKEGARLDSVDVIRSAH
jgi:GDPmannose 4,6-dehydratase